MLKKSIIVDFVLLSNLALIFTEKFDTQVFLDLGYDFFQLSGNMYGNYGYQQYYWYPPLNIPLILAGQFIFYQIIGFSNYNDHYIFALYILKLPFIIILLLLSNALTNYLRKINGNSINYRLVAFSLPAIYSMIISSQTDLIVAVFLAIGIHKAVITQINNSSPNNAFQGGILIGVALQLKYYPIFLVLLALFLFISGDIEHKFRILFALFGGIISSLIWSLVFLIFVPMDVIFSNSIQHHWDRSPGGFSFFGSFLTSYYMVTNHKLEQFNEFFNFLSLVILILTVLGFYIYYRHSVISEKQLSLILMKYSFLNLIFNKILNLQYLNLIFVFIFVYLAYLDQDRYIEINSSLQLFSYNGTLFMLLMTMNRNLVISPFYKAPILLLLLIIVFWLNFIKFREVKYSKMIKLFSFIMSILSILIILLNFTFPEDVGIID